MGSVRLVESIDDPQHYSRLGIILGAVSENGLTAVDVLLRIRYVVWRCQIVAQDDQTCHEYRLPFDVSLHAIEEN